MNRDVARSSAPRFPFLGSAEERILYRCRAASERRPRASERDPRAKNPFVTPTAPLSASRQPSPRPPRVSRGASGESRARGGANRERGGISRTLLCRSPRAWPENGSAQLGPCRSKSYTHPLTICRLTHAPPNKRPHFPNPPRPGEPETRLSSLPHPIPSPVTRSRKSSSSHARATLTLSAPCSLSRLPSFVRISRRRLSRAHPTHVPLGTAQSQVHVATSAALRASGALVGAALSC